MNSPLAAALAPHALLKACRQQPFFNSSRPQHSKQSLHVSPHATHTR